MKLDLNKLMAVIDVDADVEFVKRINRKECPLLFILTYPDGRQDSMEVDEEGKDYLGEVQIVNTPVKPTTTTYWLVHYKQNNAMFCSKKPIPPFSDAIAVTGPHYVIYKEGDGLKKGTNKI